MGVIHAPNIVLHPWIQAALSTMLGTLPETPPQIASAPFIPEWWERRQYLTDRDDDPPLRLILIGDNLAGHKSAALVRWLCAQGILPLSTPLSGSWLNLPRGRPRNRCNASSYGERWRGSMLRRGRRSSIGWRRRSRDGMSSRHRSCGRGSAPSAGNALVTDCWAALPRGFNSSQLRHDPLVPGACASTNPSRE